MNLFNKFRKKYHFWETTLLCFVTRYNPERDHKGYENKGSKQRLSWSNWEKKIFKICVQEFPSLHKVIHYFWQVFQNCSCIQTPGNSSAVLGLCDKGKDCSMMLQYFLILSVFSSFIFSLSAIPGYMVLLRYKNYFLYLDLFLVI